MSNSVTGIKCKPQLAQSGLIVGTRLLNEHIVLSTVRTFWRYRPGIKKQKQSKITSLEH